MPRVVLLIVLILSFSGSALAGLPQVGTGSTPYPIEYLYHGPISRPTVPPVEPPPLPIPTGVAVGPGGLASGSDPYYVAVEITNPEAPHAGTAADDCANGARPPSAVDEAQALLAPILIPPDPHSINSLSPYVPTCQPTPGGCGIASCPAYASYDRDTGRYYLEVTPLSMVPHHRSDSVRLTGTTGVLMITDCTGCPPACC